MRLSTSHPIRVLSLGLSLWASTLASQEAGPQPEQTITEDVLISTQTPRLGLNDPTTSPSHTFNIEFRQGNLQIGDVPDQPAISIRRNDVAGGRELTLKGFPIFLLGNVGVNAVPASPLHVRGFEGDSRPALLIEGGSATITSRNLLRVKNNGASTFRFDNVATGLSWGFGSLGSDSFFVAASGQPGLSLVLSPGGDLQIAGSLTQGSSREIKDDISPVQPPEVLARLSQLPISTWRYKHAPESLHMGPMAQDFAAAFGLGPDALHVAPADLAGVSLAAVQALHAEVAALRSELEALRAAASCVAR